METKLQIIAVVYGLILILFAVIIKYLYNRINKADCELGKIKYFNMENLRRNIDKNYIRIKCIEADIKALEKQIQKEHHQLNAREEAKQKLYEKTVKRLSLIGAKTPREQIISLAEEIEQYRDKIKRLQAAQFKIKKREILEKGEILQRERQRAIREFANNIKIAMKTRFSDGIEVLNPHFNLVSMLIDDLVEEMTEDNNGMP